LGQQIAEIKDNLKGIQSHVWHAEANYEAAEQYCLAAADAHLTGKRDVTNFFIMALEDVFNFDRALRASVKHVTPEPVRREEIPQTVTRTESLGGRTQKTQYQLRLGSFTWSKDMPSDVVLKAAKVQTANPPDDFLIAEYVPPTKKYHPIIYASYGDWHIEVGRVVMVL
jgi:hypothetical protein